jgi:hypothetical protein
MINMGNSKQRDHAMPKPAPMRLHVWGNESEGGRLVMSLIEKGPDCDIYIRTVGNGRQEVQPVAHHKKATPKLEQGEFDGLDPSRTIRAIRR